MTYTTEPSWWSAFHAGDLNGFAQLIECHQDDIFAVARATVIDPGLAEDVAQETFIAAFLRRDQLREPAAVGGWLAAIARNLGRDLLRARRRERLVDLPQLEVVSEAASESDSPHRQLDHAALCRHVRRALDRVPSRYREVLILYYTHERSVDSVARSLGLTEAATMQRLSRGRRLVRRHGVELQEFASPTRPHRAFVVAVLALLAIRGRAEAAPASPDDARPGRLPVGRRARTAPVVGLAAVLGLVGSDHASGGRPLAGAAAPPIAATREPTARTASTPRPPRVLAIERSSAPRPPPTAPTPLAPIASPDPARASRHHRTPPAVASRARAMVAADATAVAASDLAADVVAIDDLAAAAANAIIDHRATVAARPVVAARDDATEATDAVTPCQPGCRAREEAAAPSDRPIDQINGLLETAALPRPGDISYETVGLVMMVRAGLTRHLAAHVGMSAMTADATINPVFGGGIKLGARIAPLASVAVLAEAAREVSVSKLSVEDGWQGRLYAAVTLGTPRNNLTLVGGIVSEFDGTDHWRSPVVGLSSQIAWDDQLGFIIEGQRFTTPSGTLQGTSVFAVRFRQHAVERNPLGIERLRIDVGAMLLDRTEDDVDGLPWLQVGLGW